MKRPVPAKHLDRAPGTLKRHLGISENLDRVDHAVSRGDDPAHRLGRPGMPTALRAADEHLGEDAVIVEGFDLKRMELRAARDLLLPPPAEAHTGAEVGIVPGGGEIDPPVKALDRGVQVLPLQGLDKAPDDRDGHLRQPGESCPAAAAVR